MILFTNNLSQEERKSNLSIGKWFSPCCDQDMYEIKTEDDIQDSLCECEERNCIIADSAQEITEYVQSHIIIIPKGKSIAFCDGCEPMIISNPDYKEKPKQLFLGVELENGDKIVTSDLVNVMSNRHHVWSDEHGEKFYYIHE